MSKYFTPIAGVTYGNRQQVLATMNAGDTVLLRRESNNANDSNAVCVLTANGAQAGYIPRAMAAALAPLMDAGLVPANVAVAEMVGSSQDGYSLGARIVFELVAGSSHGSTPSVQSPQVKEYCSNPVYDCGND